MKTGAVLTLPPEMNDLCWTEKIEFLYQHQIETWKMAQAHYLQFSLVKKREIRYDGYRFIVQHNPSRARSTCADLNKQAIEKRPCFLCPKNLDNDQKGLAILDTYLLLINPFPIFGRHLTLSDFRHRPQRIGNRMLDMLELSRLLSDFTVFYNGPLCGASAPDHFHFQAAPKGAMPLEQEINQVSDDHKTKLFEKEDLLVYTLKNTNRNILIVESGWKEPIDYFFAQLLKALPQNKEAGEPLMNCMASVTNGKFRLVVFPRQVLRPSCFYLEDPQRIMISPATVELGGILVTPRESDFHKLTIEDISGIFSDVVLNPADFEVLKKKIIKRL